LKTQFVSIQAECFESPGRLNKVSIQFELFHSFSSSPHFATPFNPFSLQPRAVWPQQAQHERHHPLVASPLWQHKQHQLVPHPQRLGRIRQEQRGQGHGNTDCVEYDSDRLFFIYSSLDSIVGIYWGPHHYNFG